MKKFSGVRVTDWRGKVWEFPSNEIGTELGKFRAAELRKVLALPHPENPDPPMKRVKGRWGGGKWIKI